MTIFTTYNSSESLSSERIQTVISYVNFVLFPRSTFTGKERDSESGLYYFGARYHDPTLLTSWTAVDPLSDKYPNLSPYAYCAWTRPTGGHEHLLIKFNLVNNPMKLVDSDGMSPWHPKHGVWVYYLKGNISAGVGYALSASQQIGVAYDRHGTTRFTTSVSSRYFVNQNLETSYNPSYFLGADIGLGLGFTRMGDADRFTDYLDRNPVSLNTPIGATFGDGTWGGSLSLSFGISLENGKPSIQESISVSYSERDQINDQTDVITPSWVIKDIRFDRDKNGRATGCSGTVYTKNAKGKYINTGINVHSGLKPGFRPNTITTNGVWVSDEYAK